MTQVSSDRTSPERTETEVIASKTTSSLANLLINLVDKMKLIIKWFPPTPADAAPKSSFSQRISLVKGRNSNVMLSFERSKCRFQGTTECLTGDFDPHYWPFRSKTTSEKAVQKELQWNLPVTIVGQRTGNIGSLHRGSFSYISLLLGYKKIFRCIEDFVLQRFHCTQ